MSSTSDDRVELILGVIQDLIANDRELTLGLLDIMSVLASQQLQIASQRRILDRILELQSSRGRAEELEFALKPNGGAN